MAAARPSANQAIAADYHLPAIRRASIRQKIRKPTPPIPALETPEADFARAILSAGLSDWPSAAADIV